MDRTTRIAILVLVAATIVCGAVASFLHSATLAVATAVFATAAVLVGITAKIEGPVAAPATPGARSTGYDPTSSATVDVIEFPQPAETFSPDASLASAPSAPVRVASAVDIAAGAPGPLPEATMVFSPKLPPGSEPRQVVRSLLIAARAAGHPVAAHLWLEDPATETLRLVEAQGEVQPNPVPIKSTSGLLGTALSKGAAHLGPVGMALEDGAGACNWRYAVPLSGSDLRGVAAVDFDDIAEPNRAVLTTISATLRASLSGALALHVAHTEFETARALVESCAQLAHVLDPDKVLHTALDRAMEIAQAQTGSVMILDAETRRMRIAAAYGLPDDIVIETDTSEGDGIAGWVLSSRQPLVIEDLKGSGIRSRRHGVRSAVCVPLADDDGIIGVLNVGCTSYHARLSKPHLEALDALGRTVVVALRNAWASDGAQDLYFDTLKALAIALEARDPYSEGGTERIVEIADALGTYFGIPRDQARALRIAAMLHDVGMSASNAVVLADSQLSTVEWGMLKMHPVIAAEIIAEAPALRDVMPMVYHHHEHYDGSGYVEGLVAEAIPLGARILAVVDAYVAMTSERPYRSAMTHEKAVVEIERLAGSQFDPSVVCGLIAVVGETEHGGLLAN